LLGRQIDDFDDDNIDTEFCDLPTSLRTLFNRLNTWLQDREKMPIVTNPVLDDEDFNRHWNQDKYANFRNQWDRYAGWINDAYSESDKDKSIEKWQKVFGDDYAKGVQAKRVAVSSRASLPVPAYCEPPRWPVVQQKGAELKVTVHDSKEGEQLFPLSNNGVALKKNVWIRFELLNLVKNSYVYWQVVNTGKEALAKGTIGLRGGIFSGGTVNWEHTEYQGVHWVECFVVDRKKGRNGMCLYKSGQFLVNIK